MKNILILFSLLLVSGSLFGQSDPFRKIGNITWNLNNQIEYYKKGGTENGAPTSYYIEQNNIWKLTNTIPQLGWFQILGKVRITPDKADTNRLVLVDVFDPDLRRTVPKYAIVGYPKASIAVGGDKINCLVYYSYTLLPKTIERDNYQYQVVQYGIPNPESEQSFLQQIKLQLPAPTTESRLLDLPNDTGVIEQMRSPEGIPQADVSSPYKTPPIRSNPQYQNVKFILIAGDISWNEAYLDAQKRGGKLATFETPEKLQEYIRQCRPTYNSTPQAHAPHIAWIGMYRKNGKWLWINGVEISWNNWHNQSRPAGSSGVHSLGSYTVMYPGNKWNDIPSEGKFGYILELHQP